MFSTQENWIKFSLKKHFALKTNQQAFQIRCPVSYVRIDTNYSRDHKRLLACLTT